MKKLSVDVLPRALEGIKINKPYFRRHVTVNGLTDSQAVIEFLNNTHNTLHAYHGGPRNDGRGTLYLELGNRKGAVSALDDRLEGDGFYQGVDYLPDFRPSGYPETVNVRWYARNVSGAVRLP